MIFVLCANPALDRLLVLDEVVLDEVHRAKDVTVTPGGKGSTWPGQSTGLVGRRSSSFSSEGEWGR